MANATTALSATNLGKCFCRNDLIIFLVLSFGACDHDTDIVAVVSLYLALMYYINAAHRTAQY